MRGMRGHRDDKVCRGARARGYSFPAGPLLGIRKYLVSPRQSRGMVVVDSSRVLACS